MLHHQNHRLGRSRSPLQLGGERDAADLDGTRGGINPHIARDPNGFGIAIQNCEVMRIIGLAELGNQLLKVVLIHARFEKQIGPKSAGFILIKRVFQIFQVFCGIQLFKRAETPRQRLALRWFCSSPIWEWFTNLLAKMVRRHGSHPLCLDGLSFTKGL